MNNNYTKFTEEMKKTHTILIPNMLPIHFTLIKQIFEKWSCFKPQALRSPKPD